MSGVCSHGVLLHQHCRECAAPEHAAQIRGVERLREAKLRGAQPTPAQVEALQQRFIDYQRDERGRTVSEVVYWRQQYKQLAADAIAALRPQAAPAEQEALRELLAAAREVRRHGAATGSQWSRLDKAMFKAAAALRPQAAPAAQPTGGVTMSPTCACNRPSWWCVSHKCSDPYEAPAPAPDAEGGAA